MRDPFEKLLDSVHNMHSHSSLGGALKEARRTQAKLESHGQIGGWINDMLNARIVELEGLIAEAEKETARMIEESFEQLGQGTKH